MTRTTTFLGLVVSLLLPLVSACGDGGTTTGGPTAPSESSFLSGTWRGTVTIKRDGLADSTTPTTWTFELVPNTGLTTYRTTISMQDPWLPITTTVSTALTPPTPGASISTQGSFASPRGCQGEVGSNGTAQTDRIDATFYGVDCLQLPETSVFSGTVSLTKAR
jgi:hypothetical protein